MSGGTDGKDKTTITVHRATREAINALIGRTDFWGRYRYEIAPGNADEVIRGLLDIAKVMGAP